MIKHLFTNDDPVSYMFLVIQLDELLKTVVSSCYGLNYKNLIMFSRKHGLSDPVSIKNARDAIVHNLGEASVVISSINEMDTDTLISALRYFGVESEAKEIERRNYELVEYLMENSMDSVLAERVRSEK